MRCALLRLVGFLYFALALCSACGAASVQVTPSLQTVASGSVASIDLQLSGLVAGTAVGTFDVFVDFEPAVLHYLGTSFGSGLDVLGLGDIQQAVAVAPGRVQVFEVSLDSQADLLAMQPSSFRLATLSFSTMVAHGGSAISLVGNAFGDQTGSPLAISLVNGVVTVSAVPEVNARVLALTGLATLMLWTRQRRSRLPN